jgi:hypothetical protein
MRYQLLRYLRHRAEDSIAQELLRMLQQLTQFHLCNRKRFLPSKAKSLLTVFPGEFE